MTAVHIQRPALTLLAGHRALQRLKQQPLKPEDVHVIPGAAGGPKALGISGLDKSIFGDWLPRAPQPRALIGSSIGSWRLAAVASSDNPRAQLERLAELYTEQRFSANADIGEITGKSVRFLEELLAGREQQVVGHPWYHLNIIVALSRGLMARDSRGKLSLGLMQVIASNMVNRRLLGRFMERGIVRDPRHPLPTGPLTDFTTHDIPLTSDNLLAALLASASIPLVMAGVSGISGAPEGLYRDGGLVDYHLDLPWEQPGIVLYPHFTGKVIPGWFDKTLPWRRGNPQRMQDVLLIAPSPEYLAALPDGKLPDRKDFKHYAGDDKARENAWRRAIAESDRLGDAFMELVETGRLAEAVRPLG